MTKRRKEATTGYLFLTPALITLFIFTVFSILFIIFLSFTRYNTLSREMSFIGFDNYIRLFTDRRFHIALRNTVRYVLIVVPIQTVLSLLIALSLNAKVKGASIFRVIFFLPTLTSSSVLTIIFMFLFNIDGPINQILLDYNLIERPINFLTNTDFTLSIIMAMNIWSTIPFFATIYVAGLQDITEEMYEASEIDGANGIKKLLYIVIPIISPITLFVFLTGLIGCFQIFDQAYIFSNGTGGPANSTLTVTLLIYQNAFATIGTMGYAAAIAVVLAMIIFVISLLTRRWQNGGEF